MWAACEARVRQGGQPPPSPNLVPNTRGLSSLGDPRMLRGESESKGRKEATLSGR